MGLWFYATLTPAQRGQTLYTLVLSVRYFGWISIFYYALLSFPNLIIQLIGRSAISMAAFKLILPYTMLFGHQSLFYGCMPAILAYLRYLLLDVLLLTARTLLAHRKWSRYAEENPI